MLPQAHAHLNNEKLVSRVAEALSGLAGCPLRVVVLVGEAPGESPAQIQEREEQQRLEDARDAINSDPVVQDIQRRFGATIAQQDIAPNSPGGGEQ